MQKDKLENIIGDYILKNNDTLDIVSNDENLEVAYILGSFAVGLLSWYPFELGGNVLQIGSNFGAFTEYLSKRFKRVDVLETNNYRAYITNKRCKNFKNVTIYKAGLSELNSQYKYIICSVDEKCDYLPNKKAYIDFISRVKSLLTENGKFLFAVPNRLGVKYLCGAPDMVSGNVFDGITDSSGEFYRMDKAELLSVFADFKYTKIYYPVPDHRTPKLIYTDEYPPKQDVIDRFYSYFISDQDKRYLNEHSLVEKLLKNNVFEVFANSFLIEAGNTKSTNAIYSAITTGREKSKSFSTVIYNDNTVAKIPIYSDGQGGIDRLIDNTNDLIKHNIPVLPLEKTEQGLKMQRVNYITLSEYIKAIKDRKTLIYYLDKLWNYILNSSEHIDKRYNYLYDRAPNLNWGVILKTGYIEMIPVNCFYNNGKLIFFDQEYTINNCPAKLILYRAIRDIYAFSPEMEQIVPIQNIKDRYEMNEVWNYIYEVVEDLHWKLSSFDKFKGQYYWNKTVNSTLANNRRNLQMDNKLNGSFDIKTGLDGQRIILFGSGRFADYYLDAYFWTQPPVFIVDNNSEKWGTFKRGIEIKNPDEILKLTAGTYKVIITIKDYTPITEQLDKMGIADSDYRVFDRYTESLVYNRIEDPMIDGKYSIGYVTGVFDLFHIGHLNLLKRCKERCHYLIAGVLTDELATEHKEKAPFIPFEERLEIVKQCRYVDRVYVIDKHNTNKLDAWKELKYTCLFAGSDHADDPYWLNLRRFLRSVGSDLEFFPYTEGTSSTMLQQILSDNIKEDK